MTLYVLANVAYFAAIPAEELKDSGVIVAGLFFKNVFGDSAGARALPGFVAVSNLGNVLAVSFAHARVNQGMSAARSALFGPLLTLKQSSQRKESCRIPSSGRPTSHSMRRQHPCSFTGS